MRRSNSPQIPPFCAETSVCFAVSPRKRQNKNPAVCREKTLFGGSLDDFVTGASA